MSRYRTRLRVASLVVLVILLGATAGLTVAARAIVHGEERNLLDDRASEGALVLETVFAGTQSSLPLIIAASGLEHGPAANFPAVARSALGTVGTISVAQATGAGYTVSDQVGTPIPATVGPDRSALAARAAQSGATVAGLVQTPGGPRLTLVRAARSGVVVFADFAFDPNHPIRLVTGPFRDINGAAYVGSVPTRSQLVFTTTSRLPLSGSTSRATVKVGDGNLLLVVAARRPLLPFPTSGAPWVVLGGGILIALLVVFGIEAVARRQVYALALVDARTGELRTELDVQRALEEGERRAREAAETASRTKSEFLSRMSHELRTPLNAVLGFGQLLELDELTESQAESVEQIIRGGRHLLELINEVLDISRIESGNLTLSREPVLVDDVIADTLSLMRPLAEHRHISLVSRPGGELDHVVADRQRLNQILLNLISNAIKYNRPGGTVTVSSERHDEWIRIVVADTGPGIAAADLPRLFVPFDRLGAEQSGIEGTGVGLALARSLAVVMGGSLDVSSTPGEGSRFWVELPAVEGPLEDYDRRHPATPSTEAGADSGEPVGRKVLYIEDNLSNVRLVERIFARQGETELITAMQGSIGLSLAKEHRPDLVLVDLHLPDMNGGDVLTRLRADPATAAVPVVVLSADATPGSIDRLKEAGAADYLTKPLDVQALLELLERLVPVSS